MAEARNNQQFAELFQSFKSGAISRREFLAGGLALGVGMSVMGWLVRGVQTMGAAPHAQDVLVGPPAAGTEGKSRGSDGELRILQWQAVTVLSPHVATGTKDFLGSDLVLEPLMRYLPDGSLFPNLVEEVPTVANGGLSEDLTSVTFRLLPDVTWSDGEPFTAEDVAFTRDWVVNPENNSVNIEVYSVISSIEAVDDLTVQVNFETPNINWYVPFTGIIYGAVYPQHYIEANGHDAMLQAPVGTGPYVVESFAANDQVIYGINENYRFPDKPHFTTVNLKGGGAADSAAQAVLQAGDWDYAWNMQVPPEILAQFEEGGQGRLVVVPGTSVERININFSDPNLEGPDGQRSWYENPHPFLSELAVRQAMNLAIDRDLISERFYAGPPGEPATANILTGLATFDSPNTSYTVDRDEANRLLDEAGWERGGDGVRAKDGVRLEMTYSTSINLVRQRTQAVVKQGLEAIGFRVSLQEIDSSIYFDGQAGTEANINHFYTDVNMYTSGASSPTPIEYMVGWYAGPDNNNIAQAANAWNGQNYTRYRNPEYDAIFEALQGGEIADLEEAAQALIQMNDILINDVVIIPLVNRAADKYVISGSLFHDEEDNVGLSAFELNYWNIANWNRSADIGR